MLDNQDSPHTALHNAEIFVRERVDLVIESQTDMRIASRISDCFRAASIPVIALEIPASATNSSQLNVFPLK